MNTHSAHFVAHLAALMNYHVLLIICDKFLMRPQYVYVASR